MRWWNNVRAHDAQFGRITVFHTFAFDLGRGTSYEEIAQRLLKSEIAETVVSTYPGEVRLGPRYNSLLVTQRNAQSLTLLSDYLEKKISWKEVPWPTRRMYLAILWRSLRKRLWKKSRLEAGDTQESSIRDQLKGVVEGINSAVSRRQSFSALQNAVDRKLYEPGYLMKEPFLRLELRSFTGQAGNRLPPPLRVTKDVEPKVTLLIHRSGVALLTFGLRLPEGCVTDQVIPLLSSGGTAFYSAVLSAPILQNASEYSGSKEKYWQGDWLPEIKEGVRWRRFDDAGDPGSLTDIFLLYQKAILNQLSREDPYTDWLSYPTTFFEDLHCCGSRARWIGKHWTELASLLGRASLGDGLSNKVREEIIDPDHSLTQTSSLWTPGGSTVEIMWNFYSEPDRTVGDYLMRLTVSENSLLRFWQLRTLEYYIANAEPRRKDLETLLVAAINGMREYRRSYLSYGSAQDISDRIADRLGENTVLESVNMQLTNLQQLVSMKESAKASKRANQFASAAMIAAFLLGLPAIKQSLEVLQKIPGDSPLGLFSSFVSKIGITIDAAALVIYLTFVVMVAVLLVFGRISRRRFFRRKQNGEIGIRWHKGDMQVKLRNRREKQFGPNED